jgi:outer membrane lipase/esterase
MTRFILALTMAAALLGTSWARPASARQFDRIVAFGDSYADDGNIYELFGAAPPPLYPRGRFSDGTNFVDTMGEILRVPIDNFALGGAVTGTGRSNRPAGFQQQYHAFLAGGGPDYYPRVSGRFSPADLVVISIGGNDARAYEKSFERFPSKAVIASAIAGAPAAAARSVANANAGLDALARAGAHNLVFLGGDVGRLPEVKGTSIAPIGTAFSNSFNRGMRASLAKLAARGVTVTYLDLDKLGDRVEADPAAFGLISAGACPKACLSDPSLARKYLFYVDKLHFTSAGFAIIGRHAVEQLQARTARTRTAGQPPFTWCSTVSVER